MGLKCERKNLQEAPYNHVWYIAYKLGCKLYKINGVPDSLIFEGGIGDGE